MFQKKIISTVMYFITESFPECILKTLISYMLIYIMKGFYAQLVLEI